MLVPQGGGEPELSVALSLGAAQIAEIREMLAGGAMPEPAARWLESAAPYGDLREGRLAFRGRLSGTPSGDGAEKIEATGRLVVPLLSYAPGWPEITALSAAFRLDGQRFDVRIESGRILNSTIREAEVSIDDIGAEAPVARLEGRVEGATANAVRFLAESPLRPRTGPMLAYTTIHGDSTIDLELAIPLGKDDRALTVDGRVALEHNRFEVRGLGRGLKAVNGAITFRDSAVESDGITATWLDEPIRVAIGASPSAPYKWRLSIDGRLTRRLLVAYLRSAGLLEASAPDDSGLLARFRGDTAWSATLDIAPPAQELPARLQLATDLTGLSLDFPAPFGKEIGTARRLSVESRIAPGEERITQVRLGALAGAALRFVRDAGGFRFDRGTVPNRRWPRGAFRLPRPHPARRGTAARHPRVVRSARRHRGSRLVESGRSAVRRRARDVAGRGLGHRAGRSILRSAHSRHPGHRRRMAARPRRPWGGRRAARASRRALRTACRGLRAPCAGVRIRRIRRRAVQPRPSKPAGTVVSARRFVLGDYDLGRVGLTTAPSERGLEIERLDVRTDSFAGEVTGSWSLDGAEHLTEFAMRMYEVDLGRTLETLGFEGTAVAEGTTDISLRGSWQGTPADFALDRLTGVVHFLSTDGRLTRFEPGVTGHVLGLLTITSLPRRLILDFGDLFKDGFGYDRIEGSFAIEKGNAYTDDLFMESDTAKFEVVGRTGLASKDYDQLVTVIPKISSTLPLVPIWIAQKILDRNVFDKAFAYQYTITGPWAEPAVELVRTEPRAN